MYKFIAVTAMFLAMLMFGLGINLLFTQEVMVPLRASAVSTFFLAAAVLLYIFAMMALMNMTKYVAGVPQFKTWPKRFRVFWTCTLFNLHKDKEEFEYWDNLTIGYKHSCERCGKILREKVY